MPEDVLPRDRGASVREECVAPSRARHRNGCAVGSTRVPRTRPVCPPSGSLIFPNEIPPRNRPRHDQFAGGCLPQWRGQSVHIAQYKNDPLMVGSTSRPVPGIVAFSRSGQSAHVIKCADPFAPSGNLLIGRISHAKFGYMDRIISSKRSSLAAERGSP